MTDDLVGGRFVDPPHPFGAGAFGEVFRVQYRNQHEGDDPVLKRVNSAAAEDPFHNSRFRREIRTMASIDHVNVMPVIAHDLEDPTGPWPVSPLANGGNLADYITAHGPLSPAEALAILRDVAAGVGYIHSLEILHHDLSPANVLLLKGHWVISDFGLARVSHQTTTFQTSISTSGYGTADFYAPEQKTTLTSATTRSDVDSLGKLIQYVITGISPSREPQADRPLRYEIMKATATLPHDRYASPADFIAGVEAAVDHAPRDPDSVADMDDHYSSELSAGVSFFEGRDCCPGAMAADLDIAGVHERGVALIGVMSQVTRDRFERFVNVDRERAMEVLARFEVAVLDTDRGYKYVDQPAHVFATATSGNTDARIHKVAIHAITQLGARNDRYVCLDRILKIVARPAGDEPVSAMIDGLRRSGQVKWVFADEPRLERLPNAPRGRLRGLLRD